MVSAQTSPSCCITTTPLWGQSEGLGSGESTHLEGMGSTQTWASGLLFQHLGIYLQPQQGAAGCWAEDKPWHPPGSGQRLTISSPKSESEVTQLCLTVWDPMDCSPPGSSIYGIFQARILEWVVIFFSRESSWPRDRTHISHIAGRLFTLWVTKESHLQPCLLPKWKLPAHTVGKHSSCSYQILSSLQKNGAQLNHIREAPTQTLLQDCSW